MRRLHLDTIEYEFIEDDTFEKDGRTFTFASLKKVTTYKGNKKYQNVTIKHEHLDKFKEWLKDIVNDPQEKKEEVPF